jgi:hypothetical protein
VQAPRRPQQWRTLNWQQLLDPQAPWNFLAQILSTSGRACSMPQGTAAAWPRTMLQGPLLAQQAQPAATAKIVECSAVAEKHVQLERRPAATANQTTACGGG